MRRGVQLDYVWDIRKYISDLRKQENQVVEEINMVLGED